MSRVTFDSLLALIPTIAVRLLAIDHILHGARRQAAQQAPYGRITELAKNGQNVLRKPPLNIRRFKFVRFLSGLSLSRTARLLR